jgi:putative transposase
VLDANLFNALADVKAIADDWLVDYNEHRPQDSLGNVPPTPFMHRVSKPEVSTFDLSV